MRKERSIIMVYLCFLLLSLMSTSIGELNSGPMPNAVNAVMVNCSHSASDETVDGLTLYDVNNTKNNVTYSMISGKCTLGTGVMGSCWPHPGGLGMMGVTILVSGLAEGERRTYRCDTRKNDEGIHKSVQMGNITVSGPKKRTDETSGQGAKTDGMRAQEIVAWVLLALAVCVICGLLLWGVYRGVFKKRPSPAEARAAALSMIASHRRSGSGSG